MWQFKEIERKGCLQFDVVLRCVGFNLSDPAGLKGCNLMLFGGKLKVVVPKGKAAFYVEMWRYLYDCRVLSRVVVSKILFPDTDDPD